MRMMLDDMLARLLAPNMDKYLEVFCDDDVLQPYGISDTFLTVLHERQN